MPTIQTYTGITFDLADPNPDQVRIEDVAMHLSRIPRFVGATRWTYNVAQHSFLCSMECVSWPLEALLHDAAEAYTGDITSPYKQLVPQTRTVEDRIMRAVIETFDLSRALKTWAAVKRADEVLLATEARDLLTHRPPWIDELKRSPSDYIITPWPEEVSREMFLGRFWELYAARPQSRATKARTRKAIA